jgi:hydroxymethylglutaryl-CoA lyase
MADTADVLAGLDLSQTHTRLLAIVLNERGATEALNHDAVYYLGFPFSLSETFQQRNARQSLNDAWEVLLRMRDQVLAKPGHELLTYLSMGFGNPYGDVWSKELALEWAGRMHEAGIRIIALADTVGTADGPTIGQTFRHLSAHLPEVTFGGHFHATPTGWQTKVDAAWQAGCRRFDGALLGFGGCPFAQDELVGNIATENLLAYLNSHGAAPQLDAEALSEAQAIAREIFLH